MIKKLEGGKITLRAVWNWTKSHWQAIAFAGAATAGAYFVVEGGCSFLRYFGDKTGEEQKTNLEQRMVKDASWEEIVDGKNGTLFKFYKREGIPAETYCGFESGKSLQLVKGEILAGVRKTYGKEIGNRELTGPEILQVMRVIDSEKNARDLGIMIITEEEAIAALDKIKGANAEEIRSMFKIKCDPPVYASSGTEGAYQNAVNAARAEYEAAAKLSDLASRDYERARKIDELNRQREQERMRALWDLKSQPKRK